MVATMPKSTQQIPPRERVLPLPAIKSIICWSSQEMTRFAKAITTVAAKARTKFNLFLL